MTNFLLRKVPIDTVRALFSASRPNGNGILATIKLLRAGGGISRGSITNSALERAVDIVLTEKAESRRSLGLLSSPH